MDTPQTVEFLEDDEDVKYIEHEGKMEVMFPLSDMDAAADEAKGMDKDDMLLRIGGMAMEVSMAFIEEIYPAIHAALIQHYGFDVSKEEAAESVEGIMESLPGFMADLDGGKLEEP